MQREALDPPDISRPDESKPQAPAKIAYTIRQAVLASGLSRSSIYEAIKRGDLVARKLGKRTLILDEDLRHFLVTLPRVR